jgi:hypothetical protein
VIPPWWAAFGPADTSLRCGGSTHRVRWADGTLHALDHPDAEGELVLAALGGDTTPCLDLVMAWGRRSDDLTALTVGPRSPDDKVTIPAEILGWATAASGAPAGYHGLGNPQARAVSIGGTISQHQPAASKRTFTFWPAKARRVASYGLVSYRGRLAPRPAAGSGLMGGWIGFAPGGWTHPLGDGETQEAQAELVRLLALGPAFQFRLSAAVAHAWSADGEQAARADQARPALTAALTGRLAPAAARWLDIDPGEVQASIHDGDGWGELELSQTGGTGRLQARMPVRWLASVWAPGLAVVDQHLVVSVVDAAWPTARVLALRSPGSHPVELSIRQDKGHWSVTAR